METVNHYRKKPIIIEAIKWDGTNFVYVSEFIGYRKRALDCERSIIIETLEGDMKASVGDYIIKGVSGEFYPCKPDIFKKTYEPVKMQNWEKVIK